MSSIISKLSQIGAVKRRQFGKKPKIAINYAKNEDRASPVSAAVAAAASAAVALHRLTCKYTRTTNKHDEIRPENRIVH
eukprot:2877950-Amphidinium_carterae.1